MQPYATAASGAVPVTGKLWLRPPQCRRPASRGRCLKLLWRPFGPVRPEPLQERAREGSEYGDLINSYIKDLHRYSSLLHSLGLDALSLLGSELARLVEEGKLVPVEITIKLIQQADVSCRVTMYCQNWLVHHPRQGHGEVWLGGRKVLPAYVAYCAGLWCCLKKVLDRRFSQKF